MNKKQNKLWSGRFQEDTDKMVERFTASVQFDHRLASYDIALSKAHATMLADCGILSATDQQAIVSGLQELAEEIENGQFVWDPALEDVHMNIEQRLTERIGAAGKRLHTARSRNDQVATSMRLYLRAAIDRLQSQYQQLLQGLIDQAERHAAVVMPGFTHLQIAQPVSFGHHMLAWFEMAFRDSQRLADCRRRLNHMPLGAAALAGTSFPIKREISAQLLAFDGLCENSLDAVSDRDFVIEFLATAALSMTHFSRWAEEIVLWVSPLFGFVELPDRFCTGSSIMPQKKNPDVPELIRGKSARVSGHLMALLVLMKGQPLAYNRDNQEDKEPLFDSVDTLSDCLQMLIHLLPAMQPREERLRKTAADGYATATDLADYLVRQGLPFRDAHAITGQAVQQAIAAHCRLDQLPLPQLQALHPKIDHRITAVLSVDGSLACRNHRGGTAPKAVEAACQHARQRFQNFYHKQPGID